MKKKLLIILGLFIINSAHAGFNGLTYHSRANCANNESITWDALKAHKLYTSSHHIKISGGYVDHTIVAKYENTWRSAAVCWGEGRGGYTVYGYHEEMVGRNHIIKLGGETVEDCSIYDGWWDIYKTGVY